MSEPAHRTHFPKCPKCGSNNVRRSKRRGAADFVLKNLLFKVPYRCEDCDERFFGFRTSIPKKFRKIV
jgi:transposase-like protein